MANEISYTYSETLSSPVHVKSNSFTADRKSFFKIGESYERLKRGLTLIHFQSDNTYEFRNFDTYGSKEDSDDLLAVLQQMLNNEAIFMILAHDSATETTIYNAKEFAQIGLTQLSSIKNRQAYLMHTFSGKIWEAVEDLTIEKTLSLPSNLTDEFVYFPKETYEFEPDIKRFIAHAGGEVNGVKSTNTKDALDQNYKKGFRIFELDIIETSDGHLVAAHDWNMWARFTDYSGSLPPTRQQFLKEKIYGDYSLLDFDGINEWFAAHKDAILVTDKVNDPIAFADAFVDKSRLIMELFSVMSVEEAAQHGINAMISHQPFFALQTDKLDFLKINNVKYVAMSRRAIENNVKLLKQLRDNGIKVYVYHVNFDEGKDETYVLENEIGLVFGMYADSWKFDKKPKARAK